jgi:mannose/fructose/N-acetylgalactosamine-specific phosphotransferase system component IID
MDSILSKTVLVISQTLGIGTTETYLLIGAVLLFTVYKIIDLA